jgi:6-phosphogluconate dehydrogenase
MNEPQHTTSASIGLAVMGQNLVLNVESRGFSVSVFNRTASVTHDFVARAPGQAAGGCDTLPASWPA